MTNKHKYKHWIDLSQFDGIPKRVAWSRTYREDDGTLVLLIADENGNQHHLKTTNIDLRLLDGASWVLAYARELEARNKELEDGIDRGVTKLVEASLDRLIWDKMPSFSVGESFGLKDELAKQAKLNGKGAEREVELIGKVQQLERQQECALERIKELENRLKEVSKP